VGLYADPGNLKGLGLEVGRNTIRAILTDHGIAPAPERGTNTPWKTFLAAHWDVGPIQCRERLGGLLTFYYRDAA